VPLRPSKRGILAAGGKDVDVIFEELTGPIFAASGALGISVPVESGPPLPVIRKEDRSWLSHRCILPAKKPPPARGLSWRPAGERFEPIRLYAVVAGLPAQRQVRLVRLHQSGKRYEKIFGRGAPPRVRPFRCRVYGNERGLRGGINGRWQEIGVHWQPS